jgi:transcriptional regulator with XRE-family HTH domain
MVCKTLAERLEHLLSSLNIKQRDFAERVGFTQSYVSLILNGTKKSPSARFFAAVSREFSINPDWLREGKGAIHLVSGLNLAPADAELMARYRLLPSAEQAMVVKIIDALLANTLAENRPKRKT